MFRKYTSKSKVLRATKPARSLTFGVFVLYTALNLGALVTDCAKQCRQIEVNRGLIYVGSTAFCGRNSWNSKRDTNLIAGLV